MDKVDRILSLVTDRPGLCGPVLEFLELAEALVSSAGTSEVLDTAEVEGQLEHAGDCLITTAMGEVLLALDPKSDVVSVNGVHYRRMGEASSGVYFARRGVVIVDRHLFRQIGVHNGPTIVPLELRAGLVDGRWTPLAAAAAAHLLQQGTSREAAATSERMGTLKYSSSSLGRVGQEIGECWERHHFDGEDHLAASLVIPEQARSLSVSVDRVAVPMAEPMLNKDGSPSVTKKGWPRKSIRYRMAYCGVITLYDKEGDPLVCTRYGRMPQEGRSTIEESLWGDVAAILAERPGLKVVGLADGAHEMQNMLRRIMEEACCPGAPLGVDFWHVVEKLCDAVRATGREPNDYRADFKATLKADDYGIEKIELRLRTWLLEYEHDDDVPQPLSDALTYIENHREEMRYRRLLEAGLPIGSGTVEATCKTLVSVRMKRAGAAWYPKGAQAVLGLRSLAKSSRWEEAMEFLLPTYVTLAEEVAEAA